VNVAESFYPSVQVVPALKQIQQYRGSFLFINEWPTNLLTQSVAGTGSVSWLRDYVELSTGITGGSWAVIFKQAFGQLASGSVPPPWTVKRYFGVNVTPLQSVGQYVHLVSGGISSFTSNVNTEEHVGFKIIGATIYGTVGDGANESTLNLGTVTANDTYILECEFIPGSKCKFWVNRDYKGEITTNLPYTSGASVTGYDLFDASISNPTDLDFVIDIATVRVLVEEYA